MTEHRSGAAGWRTAAAVAPAAAAALAMSTGWALAHPPEGSATPVQPQAAPAADPALNRVDLRRHQEALDARARVEHLSRVLHRLRTGGSTPPLPAAPAAPAPEPAPAPAPATDTSTGAS